MRAEPNARCGRSATAAEFVRLGPTSAEVWIGHDEEGRSRYGWLVEGTADELEVVRRLLCVLNDPTVKMLPGTMGEAMRAAYLKERS